MFLSEKGRTEKREEEGRREGKPKEANTFCLSNSSSNNAWGTRKERKERVNTMRVDQASTSLKALLSFSPPFFLFFLSFLPSSQLTRTKRRRRKREGDKTDNSWCEEIQREQDDLFLFFLTSNIVPDENKLDKNWRRRGGGRGGSSSLLCFSMMPLLTERLATPCSLFSLLKSPHAYRPIHTPLHSNERKKEKKEEFHSTLSDLSPSPQKRLLHIHTSCLACIEESKCRILLSLYSLFLCFPSLRLCFLLFFAIFFPSFIALQQGESWLSTPRPRGLQGDRETPKARRTSTYTLAPYKEKKRKKKER